MNKEESLQPIMDLIKVHSVIGTEMVEYIKEGGVMHRYLLYVAEEYFDGGVTIVDGELNDKSIQLTTIELYGLKFIILA